MKKHRLPFLFLLFVTAVCYPFSTSIAQGGPQPDIIVKESEYDFKTRKQHTLVEHVFVIRNAGTAPLIIADVQRSCGCTTPEFSKEPIAPGKTGVIKVHYDSKRVGPFNKSITVKTNDPDQPETVIKIKGIIEAAPAEGAPVRTE